MWKDEVLREDVSPENVVARRLLGPLVSVAVLLMPIIPVVGLHGGATLVLALMRGGLVHAVDLRLSLSLVP